MAREVQSNIHPTDCVVFLQRLLQTQSLPGNEGPLADLVCQEMTRLRYDTVYKDEAGNVIGILKGRGEAPATMFNTHLDHVDAGEESDWPYPPFGGIREGNRVWGRGAVDIKGPLAAQVHAVGQLISEGLRPPGDIYVTAVVQEEVGGLGARHLVTHLQPPFVVVGEPSQNELRRGHRGRTELLVRVRGSSIHASIPHRGVNPLSTVARFLLELEKLEMKQDRSLGASSVAATLIRTDQSSANVTPGAVELTCDWRSTAQEQGEEILSRVQSLLDRCLQERATGSVEIPALLRSSYTGFKMRLPAEHPSYLLQEDHPSVRAAEEILAELSQREARAGIWQFATDGGYFAQTGASVIGFGPGDDTLAHTVNEYIEVDELLAGLEAYKALGLRWAGHASQVPPDSR